MNFNASDVSNPPRWGEISLDELKMLFLAVWFLANKKDYNTVFRNRGIDYHIIERIRRGSKWWALKDVLPF